MASPKSKKRSEKQNENDVKPPRSKLSKDDLERMVEEATVDANDESEQVTGFYTMFENDLELPFNTVVLGAEVTVERIDIALSSARTDMVQVKSTLKLRTPLP